jgi:hypothetical protein
MLVEGFANVFVLISLVLLGMAVFAFIDAAMRRADAYPAADKKTKPFWMIILGLTVVINLPVIGLSMIFLQVIGLIATIVYLVDVRPALRGVSGPRRGGGSSSDGPYGPWNGGR